MALGLVVIVASIVALGIYLLIARAPRIRHALGRHRVLVAVFPPPLLPLLLLLIFALLGGFAWPALLAVISAYISGLVAYALVTAVQDNRRQNRQLPE
jgi:hypothetical protein